MTTPPIGLRTGICSLASSTAVSGWFSAASATETPTCSSSSIERFTSALAMSSSCVADSRSTSARCISCSEIALSGVEPPGPLGGIHRIGEFLVEAAAVGNRLPVSRPRVVQRMSVHRRQQLPGCARDRPLAPASRGSGPLAASRFARSGFRPGPAGPAPECGRSACASGPASITMPAFAIALSVSSMNSRAAGGSGGGDDGGRAAVPRRRRRRNRRGRPAPRQLAGRGWWGERSWQYLQADCESRLQGCGRGLRVAVQSRHAARRRRPARHRSASSTSAVPSRKAARAALRTASAGVEQFTLRAGRALRQGLGRRDQRGGLRLQPAGDGIAFRLGGQFFAHRPSPRRCRCWSNSGRVRSGRPPRYRIRWCACNRRTPAGSGRRRARSRAASLLRPGQSHRGRSDLGMPRDRARHGDGGKFGRGHYLRLHQLLGDDRRGGADHEGQGAQAASELESSPRNVDVHASGLGLELATGPTRPRSLRRPAGA